MTGWQSLFFPALFYLCIGIASAAGQSGTLRPDTLEYYRQQAFNSPAAPARFSLNHIGIAGESVAGGYLVTAVLDDYPAHGAGIQRGDLIIGADGSEFHPVFSYNERLRAPDRFQPRSQRSELSVLRTERQLRFVVTPVFENLFDSYRSATLNSVQQFASGNKSIGYVRLWALSAATSDLISYARIFAELEATDGIILDLRNADGFLSTDQLGLIYRGTDNLPRISSDDSRRLLKQPAVPLAPVAYRNPVAILINQDTEGGAELMAYQLDKLTRVITLGRTTAGRIGRYVPVRTPEGPALRYLPGDKLRIDGQAFENQGHAPEQEVNHGPGRSGRLDLQFQTAFDVLMEII